MMIIPNLGYLIEFKMKLRQRKNYISLMSVIILLLHTNCYSNTNNNEIEIFETLDSEELSVIDTNRTKVIQSNQVLVKQQVKPVPGFVSDKETTTTKVQEEEPLFDVNSIESQPDKDLEDPKIVSEDPIKDSEDINQPMILDKAVLGISTKVETIDLPTSVGIALAKNIDIKISTLRNDQEKWKYVQAWTDLLPNVTLGYNFARYQGTQLVGGVIPVSVIRSSVVPSLIGDATIFNGFRNLFNAIAEKHQYKASINTLEANLDEVIYSVTEGYYSLLKEKANCIVDDKTLEDANEQLKLNQERYFAGVGTKLDVLQSQSLVSQAEQQLIQSQNSLKLAMVSFANLIGIDLYDQLLPIEDQLEMQNLIPADITLQEMVDVALLSRSEVSRDRHLIKSLIVQRRAAFSNYLPHASVSGGLQGSGDKISNVRKSQYISINLQWKGLEKMGTSGILKSNEIGAQVNEAKLNLYNTMRDIQEDVISAYYSRDTSNKLLESSKVKVEADKESLRLAKLRLTAGVGINSDYISAQRSLAQSRAEYINSIINYNLSEVKLLRVMGIIDLGNIKDGITKKEIVSICSVK